MGQLHRHPGGGHVAAWIYRQGDVPGGEAVQDRLPVLGKFFRVIMGVRIK